jgi:hypothetical protein
MSRIVYLLGSAHFVGNFGNEHVGTFVRGFFIGEQREGEPKNCIESRAKLSSLLEMYETCLAPVLLRILVFASAFYQYKGHVTKFPCVPLQSSQPNGQIVKCKNYDSYICLYNQYKIIACMGH